MSILVIAEIDGQKLGTATLNTVAAAKELGGDIDLLVAGKGIAEAANAGAKLDGIKKVLKADAAHLDNGLAENMAPLIVELAANYNHIVMPATTYGKNIAPRVAALMDTQQISDITKVINDKTFERPVYAGNALAVVESSDDKKVITVRGTAFDKVAETGSASIEDVTSGSDTGLSSFKSAMNEPTP